MTSWTPVIVAAASAIVVAVAGGLLTDIGPWYQNLKKPSWNPPNWLFGPVWTTIFTLAAISGVTAWNAAATPTEQGRVVTLFAINGILNVAWSLLFFRLHRPDWALAENGLLWLSVFALAIGLHPLSPAASFLIVPYLAWVSFAAYLNWVIVVLNRPFR